MDFDDVTTDIFYSMKMNLFKSRIDELEHIKRDNMNDNITENYNPNSELNEILKPTINDYDHELYKFTVPDPL